MVSRTFIALDGEKRSCGARVAWKEPKRSFEEKLGRAAACKAFLAIMTGRKWERGPSYPSR